MSRILFEFFDGEQTLVVVGIPSAEAFGTPVIDAGQELLVSGIASEEAFGTPKFIRHPRVITTWVGGGGGGGGGGLSHDPTALFFLDDPHELLHGEVVPTELAQESRREVAQRNMRPWLEEADLAAVPEDLWELFDDRTYPIRLAYGAVWLWLRVHRAGGIAKAETRRRAGADAEQERAFWAMVAAVEEAARARAAADRARTAVDLALAMAAADVSRAAADASKASEDVSRAAADVSRAAKAVQASLRRKRRKEEREAAAQAQAQALEIPSAALPVFAALAPVPTSSFVPLLVGAIVAYGVWSWVTAKPPSRPPEKKRRASGTESKKPPRKRKPSSTSTKPRKKPSSRASKKRR